MSVRVRDASHSGAASGSPPLGNTARQTSSCFTATPPPINECTAMFRVPPGAITNQSVRKFPDASIHRPTRSLGPNPTSVPG